MGIRTALLAAIVLTAASGQQSGAAQDKPSAKAANPTIDRKEFDALRREIIALRAEIISLNQEAADAAKENLKRWTDVVIDIAQLKQDSASFDPASPGSYQRINTDVGPLIVSLGSIEPYLDGYGSFTLVDIILPSTVAKNFGFLSVGISVDQLSVALSGQ